MGGFPLQVILGLLFQIAPRIKFFVNDKHVDNIDRATFLHAYTFRDDKKFIPR